MRIARVLGFSALVFAGLATLALIGYFIMAWRGETLSREARQLEDLFEQRPTIADADNAWIDLYGFAAPADVDAHAHGLQRVNWMRRSREAKKKLGEDPGKADLSFDKLLTPTSKRLKDACYTGPARGCLSALAVINDEPLIQHEAVLLARYRELQSRSGWYEALGFAEGEPLPNFGDAINAQRIMLLHLRRDILRGQTAGVRDALQRDLVFWREVLRSADSLISKMLAVAFIRQHFIYANLALREMPAGSMELVPPSWHEPFTAEELSMWRAMAGEYQFARGIINQSYAERYAADEDDSPLERFVNGFDRRSGASSELNQMAKLNAGIAKAFSVPVERYFAANDALVSSFGDVDRVANTAHYAVRVGSVEGMRRGALLTAQLRGRAVPADELEAELRKSELRMPFDGLPFIWDAADAAVVYEGPEKRRRKLSLPY